jgi:RNA polymerase sigma-70 factor (ECF subfamily)
MAVPRSSPSAPVQLLPWAGDDEQLLAVVRRGGPAAAAIVFDRYGDTVNRVVARCLGPDPDHDDVVHDAFVHILRGLPKLRDPGALRGFVRAVAVNTVRTELRRRRFRRAFWWSGDVPEPAVDGLDPEGRDLLRRVYAILDRLAPDLRIAFTLRFVERHALTEIAELTGASLATVKRRIARASKRFTELAEGDDELIARMAGGTSWASA